MEHGQRPATDDPLSAVAALPGVPEAVIRVRIAIDAARAHPVMRRRGPHVAAESALRGARASAALEGAVIELPALREAVRRGALGSAAPDRALRDRVLGDGAPGDMVPGDMVPGDMVPGDMVPGDMALIAGAVRVSAELASLAPIWRHAPLQVLARLHVLAAGDLLEPDRLGRPRGPGDPLPGDPMPGAPVPFGTVGLGTVGLGSAGPLGSPSWPVVPSAAEATARLDQLARLLTAPSRAPALIVAAVAHGELLAIRAFAGADGLLARAVSRLVLITRGLDPASVAVPEVGHLEMGRRAYAVALHEYVTGGAEGVARWVVHCGDAIALGARETVRFGDAMQAAADLG
jgi:hypothetical protein